MVIRDTPDPETNYFPASLADCSCEYPRDRLERILTLRAAGHVQRCHTEPHHGRYLISEHVGQMLVLLFALHPNPSINLAGAIVFHDHPELETGDTPAPGKRGIPGLKECLGAHERDFFDRFPETWPALHFEEDRRWLKALDYLELYLWCRDQMSLGNRRASAIARTAEGYIREMSPPIWEVTCFLDAEKSVRLEKEEEEDEC